MARKGSVGRSDISARPEPGFALNTGGGSVFGRAELAASIFGAGAAVMVIEVLGTRIIGPVFGVNLFIWAALLTVTLAGLATGYYCGGVLVDRRPTAPLLNLVILGAGVLLGLVPISRHVVLTVTSGLGPRWGSLVSAGVLFAPALGALGMTGPIAVRLAVRDLGTTGHGVGRTYAISTAGSLLGTLLVAFALVPNFETNQILVGTACFLVLLGGVPLAARGRRRTLLALVVPLAGLYPWRADLPAGVSILARAQSLHGLVEVIEDRNRGFRALRADHSLIGGRWSADRTPIFAFLHQIEAVRFARPDAKRLLQIGLGIGSLPMSLRGQGIVADVVEIDPNVVQMAREYFDFTTEGTIFTEDARALVQRMGNDRYDLVVHDTFTGGTVPEHLFSLEVLQHVHALLRPGGLLALNFFGYQRGPNVQATLDVLRTLQAVFPEVRVFRDMSPDELPDSAANLIFFASERPIDFPIPPDATFENEACERTLRRFLGWELFKETGNVGQLITDDRNPLARLQLAIAADHFRFMQELFPPSVWLQ